MGAPRSSDRESTIRKSVGETAAARSVVPTTRTEKLPDSVSIARGSLPSRAATPGEAMAGRTRSKPLPVVRATAPPGRSRSSGNSGSPAARAARAYDAGSTPTRAATRESVAAAAPVPEPVPVPPSPSAAASDAGFGRAMPYSTRTGAAFRTPSSPLTVRTRSSGSVVRSLRPLIRASAPTDARAASSRASPMPATTEPPNAAVASASSRASSGSAPPAEDRPARASERKPIAPRSRAMGRVASRSGSGWSRTSTSAAISATSTGAALTSRSVPPSVDVPRRRSAVTAATARTSRVSSTTVRRREGRALTMSSRGVPRTGRMCWSVVRSGRATHTSSPTPAAASAPGHHRPSPTSSVASSRPSAVAGRTVTAVSASSRPPIPRSEPPRERISASSARRRPAIRAPVISRTTAATEPIPRAATAMTGLIASRIRALASTRWPSPVPTTAVPPAISRTFSSPGPLSNVATAARSREPSGPVRAVASGGTRQ